MKKRSLLLIFCAVILLIYYSPITAAFEKKFLGSARYIGLGCAYVGMSDDETAVFINPAGLVNIRLAGVALTGGSMYAGLDMGSLVRGNICSAVNFDRLRASSPDSANIGILGLGIDYFSAGTSEGDSYNETVFVFSYARKLLEGIGGGINLKIPRWSSEVGGDSSYEIQNLVVSMDVGVLIVESKNLSIGGAIYDILEPDIYAKFEDESGFIPFSGRFGLSYTTKEKFMTINMDIIYQEDVIDLAAGLEVKLKGFLTGAVFKSLTLRSGLYLYEVTEGFDYSFGVGYLSKIKNHNLRIDYAFKYPIMNGIGGTLGTHFLTTSFGFGRPGKVTMKDFQIKEKVPDAKESEEPLKDLDDLPEKQPEEFDDMPEKQLEEFDDLPEKQDEQPEEEIKNLEEIKDLDDIDKELETNKSNN